MTHDTQEYQYHSKNALSVFIGLLVGGLAGAVTMLLLAPQSGRDTRIQIQKKGIELRDRTTEIVEDTLAQVRSSRDKLTISGREKLAEIKQQGQALVAGQLEHVSDVAQAGKKAIEGS